VSEQVTPLLWKYTCPDCGWHLHALRLKVFNLLVDDHKLSHQATP
jgi:hypothetical protein